MCLSKALRKKKSTVSKLSQTTVNSIQQTPRNREKESRGAYEEHDKEEQGEKKEQRTEGRMEEKARCAGDVSRRLEARWIRAMWTSCTGKDSELCSPVTH